MFTAKEIWEAGKAALEGKAKEAASAIPATVGPVMREVKAGADPSLSPTAARFESELQASQEAPAGAPVVFVPADSFDPADFDFEPGTYRVHFKNGHSGEYDGVALAHSFPFDPAQVQGIERVEVVGLLS
ncbi:MAG TPA: hypothetical protein VKP61_08825 [Candidatus Acidoferrum sp.]|nr:hypothetical protein [Candidatus Acidoferrum sp.]